MKLDDGLKAESVSMPLQAPDNLQGCYSNAISLVEAHINEHGEGVVAVVGPKKMVGLLPLALVGASAPSQALVHVQPML